MKTLQSLYQFFSIPSSSLLLLSVSCPPLIVCNKTFVRNVYEQSAILNNRFYINGGRAYCSDPENQTGLQVRSYCMYPNSGLRFIDQSDANLSIQHIPAPPDVPVVAMGALWSDGKDSLYLFGGQYDVDPSSSTHKLPPRANELWSYSESNSSWVVIPNTNTPSLRPAHGAAISVPKIQMGFYLGGWADNTTTSGLEQRVFLNTLTIFDMERRRFESETIPQGSNPFRAGGRLVYVPVGKSGILLALGGCSTGFCEEYISLGNIDVYDIASRNWYTQNTSYQPDIAEKFRVPQDRYDFCAVSVSSWDRTSHSVYIWSGGRLRDTGVLDDVWVLTLPMFRWIPLYGGPFERKASTCELAHERFLMFSGGCGAGSNEAYCQPVGSEVGTFDLTMGSDKYWDGWQSAALIVEPWAKYEPSLATYLVAGQIRRTIGGYDLGDTPIPANVVAPINGWDQTELGLIFSITPTRDPAQRETKNYLKISAIVSALLLGLSIFSFILMRVFLRLLQWRKDKIVFWNSALKLWNTTIVSIAIQGKYSAISTRKPFISWRPLTLRLPYLTFLVFISIALLLFVELLLQYSLQPEDTPTLRDGYVAESVPKHPGYFPTIETRPRRGLYHFWDNETHTQKARNESSRIQTPQYIVWNYLPTVITVVFGILWGLCDAEAQRIEPYYQLHRENGSLGEDSLSIDYHGFWAPLRISQAVRKGHWACVISGIAYIVAFAVLPNLQNFLFSWEKRSGGTYTWTMETHSFRVGVVDPIYARVIESMLAVEIICGILLLWIYQSRNTGLDGNPAGLAAVAGLISRGGWPGEGIGLGRTSQEIEQDVAGRRFKTEYAEGQLNLWEIQTSVMSGKKSRNFWKFLRNRRAIAIVSSVSTHYKRCSDWIWGFPIYRFLRRRRISMLDAAPLLLFAITLAVILSGSIFILVQMLAVENRGSYRLPLPPNLYLILGVFIKSIYEVVDSEVRIIAPYRKLSIDRYQRPKVLWEDYTTIMPGWVTILAFQNGHGILGLVTFNSLALELWTILLGSLQVSASDFGSTTYAGDAISLSLAIVCNFIALVSLIVVLRNIHSDCLPCRPGTISSIASLVSKSKMLKEDFGGIGLKKKKKLQKDLERKSRRYGFGWSREQNEDYLTIDYESLSGDYKIWI